MKKLLLLLLCVPATAWPAEAMTAEQFHEQWADEAAESIANRLKLLTQHSPDQLLSEIADAVKEDVLHYQWATGTDDKLMYKLASEISVVKCWPTAKSFTGVVNSKEFSSYTPDRLHSITDDLNGTYCVVLSSSCFKQYFENPKHQLYFASIDPAYRALLKDYLTEETLPKIFAPFIQKPDDFMQKFQSKTVARALVKKAAENSDRGDKKSNAGDDDK